MALAVYGASILLTIAFFIIFLPADFYHFADIHYAGKEVKVKTVICEKEKDTNQHLHLTSYNFYLPTISSDMIPYKPEEPLQPMDEHLLSALDKSTLHFLKVYKTEFFEMQVSREQFKQYNKNDTITMGITKGGYGKNIIHNVLK